MMNDEQINLDFYIEKPRNILRMFLMFAFAMLGIVFSIYSIINMELFLFAFGIFLALPFTVILFLLIKRTASPDPYITLTEEGLIIYAYSEHAILILWKDISGYQIRHVSFNRFIDVIFDQDKYLSSMSRQSKKLYRVKDRGNSLFAFPLGNIKPKDKRKLISELDRLVETPTNLTEQVYHPKNICTEKLKTYDRINKKYFLGSYGYSLIFTVLALFIFFLTHGDRGYFILIVLQFILFPFSKLFYDVLVGFKLNDFLDKQEHTVTIFLDRLMFIFYLIFYLFTVFLAPLGILYLIIVSLYRFIKRKWF